ncbi:unnamed protein product [Polarella glacialis]|uniref:Uncharacterized protein n=1 Tax=Polarella glacialis TaxID=89957 RepID=A0A813LWM7_POLGL|nr:unnamed protein product [Polarella glacialis]
MTRCLTSSQLASNNRLRGIREQPSDTRYGIFRPQLQKLKQLLSDFKAMVLLPEGDCDSADEDMNHKQDLPDSPMSAETRGYLRVDCNSIEGLQACKAVLLALEAAASSLGLAPAPRQYRQGFSANYAAIFAGHARCYRADVLEAALASHKVRETCVNGVRYPFPSQLLENGAALRRAWAALAEAICKSNLEALRACGGLQSLICWWPGAADQQGHWEDLRVAVHVLDEAWAAWENCYITELIRVEEEARRPLRAAIAAAKQVDGLSGNMDSDAIKCIDQMVSALAHLNTIANPQGKGRGDLDGRVLRAALAWLELEEGPNAGTCTNLLDNAGARSLVQNVAGRIVDAFLKCLDYLCHLEPHLCKVDPWLGRNAGLAERLLDLEEQWELGERLLMDTSGFGSLLQLASTLEAFSGSSEAFRAMLEECDAELFMVLPRLVWLCALQPSSGGRQVLGQMLPCLRFNEDEESLDNDHLAGLRALFTTFCEGLLQFMHASRPSLAAFPAEQHAQTETSWAVAEAACLQRLLFQAAVAGPADCSKAAQEVLLEARSAAAFSMSGSPCSDQEGLFEQLETLLRELEGWSLKLQRHCPQDWNCLSSVLVGSIHPAAVLPQPATAENQAFQV